MRPFVMLRLFAVEILCIYNNTHNLTLVVRPLAANVNTLGIFFIAVTLFIFTTWNKK